MADSSKSPPPLENLKPALAGFIVDHQVGRKEAFATFFDLVIFKHISKMRDSKTGDEYFILSDKDRSSLTEYESRILDLMTNENGKSMRMSQMEAVRFLALAGENSQFQEMVRSAAIDSGLYRTELRSDMLTVLATTFARLARIEKVDSDLSTKMVMGALVLSAILVALALWLQSIGALALNADQMSNIPICVFFAIGIPFVIAISIYRTLERHLTMQREQADSLAAHSATMTSGGAAQKQRYLDLYKWLQSNPLKNYRWSNEFLPYAVAFGLYKDYEKFPK
ncbi:Uncharacterised protein [uncultured archaeon]|nr:Uncharacterised protein [uncultured archaeon]